MRAKKAINQAYRDFGNFPSVPPFVINANQLIDNIKSISRVQYPAAPPTVGTSTSNKRNSDAVGVLSPSSKRARTGLSFTLNVVGRAQDDERESASIPSRPAHPRAALTKLSTNRISSKRPQRRRKSARSWREQEVHRESIGALAKIASKLRASVHAIAVDRETLRQRWEVDEHLQLQHITDNLVDLNECFTSAEKGIHGALEVIEKRLL